MPRIYLVGFMGSGKSSTALRLAEILGLGCVDLDVEVEERFGMSIAEIFTAHGEAAFRRAEAEALATTTSLGDVVVALGGGAFAAEENRAMIHAGGGVSVFLDVPWEVILERLRGDNPERPMFGDPGSAMELFEERRQSYQTATFVMQVEGSESPDEVARTLSEVLEEAACAT